MTASVRAQLLAAGAKMPIEPRNLAPKPRTSVAPTKDTKAPVASVVAPAFESSPAAPCTHLVGPYAVSVGGRLHAEQLPDRIRIVITGPASEDLPAALVAALTQFVKP